MRFLYVLLILFLSVSSGATCVSTNEVELKSKPDANAKSSWIVGKNMPLLEVDRKGAWIQVMDVDSTKHWIHARNLTNKSACLIVRSETANLRLGPGTQYPLTPLSYARKYSTFRKIDRDEDWIKVQDDFGQVHWLHEQNVWEPRVRTKVSF